MKLIASGGLVLAAVIFVVCRVVGDGHGVWPFVQAASEAAMVGGLADWFAVTALFRHPLGLPIPHTAIIPRKKDQIGESLGDFIEQNFLTPENIIRKLEEHNAAKAVAEWLVNPQNSHAVAQSVGEFIPGLLRAT